MRRIKVKLVDGREIERLLPETPAEIATVRASEQNGAVLTEHSFGDVLPKLKTGAKSAEDEGT